MNGLPCQPRKSEYLIVTDEKATNTSGGTFTAGAWYTRDLNTLIADTGNLGRLRSNQLSLAAGTYRCLIHVPGYSVGRHQVRLKNITTGNSIYGSSCFAYGPNQGYDYSIIANRFTIAERQIFEIQHYCESTSATYGFGVEANMGGTREVYTVSEFWREGSLPDSSRFSGKIILVDEKPSATDGGTFTSSAWRTRDLNTVRLDTGNHCKLSANQFTLQAGIYRLRAFAPAYNVNRHKAIFQNISTGETVAQGTSGFSYALNANYSFSYIVSRFTVVGRQTFEIQHACQTTTSTYGYGVQAGMDTENYTTVQMLKEG